MKDITTLCYIKKENKYLFLLRGENKSDAGKWSGVGGHFHERESPRECIIREAKEETGYDIEPVFRGIVTFVNGDYTEYMFIFTSENFTGEEIACNEGRLEWIEEERILSLNTWQADKIFLKYIIENRPFFSLKAVYEGDTLLYAKEEE